MPPDTDSYTDADYDATIDALDEVLKQRPKDAVLYMGGDINGAMGVANDDADLHDSPLGRFGVQHTNDRGLRFLEYLQQDQLGQGPLCSVGTYFQKKKHGTWRHASNPSPDGTTTVAVNVRLEASFNSSPRAPASSRARSPVLAGRLAPLAARHDQKLSCQS